MDTLTKKELEFMNKDVLNTGNLLEKMKNPIWFKVFFLYNKEQEFTKQVGLFCRPCYAIVTKFFNDKNCPLV